MHRHTCNACVDRVRDARRCDSYVARVYAAGVPSAPRREPSRDRFSQPDSSIYLVHDAGPPVVGDPDGNHYRAVRGHWYRVQRGCASGQRWQGLSCALTQPMRHNLDNWDRMMMRRDYRITGSTRGQAVCVHSSSPSTIRKRRLNLRRIASGAPSAYRNQPTFSAVCVRWGSCDRCQAPAGQSRWPCAYP